MAEPTNTPMPPSTPIPAATPRSSSPAPPLPSVNGSDGGSGPLPLLHLQFGSTGAASGPSGAAGAGADADTYAAAAPAYALITSPAPTGAKPRVLHIGDPCRYNLETSAAFSTQFDVVRPTTPERRREAFATALRERRWGDFDAIFRPFWGSGGEMGQWDAELIDLLPPSVKVFASAGAGFDWANTRLLGEKGIIYCNSGLAAAEAVADFAVAMIISTFRHLPWCLTAATAADPPTFLDCHRRATGVSHNLRGQVLGLIGLGNIGQQIAARCGVGFGMVVHYHDVERKPAAVEEQLAATFHAELTGLLRAADCIVLCTPASAAIGGGALVTADTLAWLKPGARFVNISRGSLVDEAALVAALESGHVGGAALDVHEREPNVHPQLVKMALGGGSAGGGNGRVMLSCHNAGGTVETHKGFEELSMRNIMAVLAGGQAITPVNLAYLKPKE